MGALGFEPRATGILNISIEGYRMPKACLASYQYPLFVIARQASRERNVPHSSLLVWLSAPEDVSFQFPFKEK